MSIRRFSNENFSDKKHKVASNLVSTETIVQNSFDITQSVNQLNQFGADGSQLLNLPAKVHPGEQLLKQAVWWIDSAHSSADGQEIQNLGWGGNALNAQLGSAPGPDSNDPKFLPWEGENYVYLPGVPSNYLRVPDEAALDITGDIDIRVRVAVDDWTPSSTGTLISKYGTTTGSQSWMLRVTATGFLVATISDGITLTGAFSTVAVDVSDGPEIWVRWTVDVDNGASGNTHTFYTSTDGVTWNLLGSPVTNAGTITINSGTNPVIVGARGSGTAEPLAMKVYRAQILDGINGTTVLDVDTSLVASGSDTSFTARTGQTVTINRSTSGRKAVAVTHPMWLFGTDDYMEVADNDLLDFGASDSFTVLAVVRQWATLSQGQILSKRSSAGGANPGYNLETQTTTAKLVVYDGTYFPSATASISLGDISIVAGVRNTQDDDATVYVDGFGGTSVTDTTTGTLSNALPLRIGSWPNAVNTLADMEFIAAAVFRRALTASEITTLNNYFQGRAA